MNNPLCMAMCYPALVTKDKMLLKMDYLSCDRVVHKDGLCWVHWHASRNPHRTEPIKINPMYITTARALLFRNYSS